MILSELSQIISNLGFPIFVAVWMLLKSSKDAENITKALLELKVVIEKLSDKCGGCDGGK